MNDRERSTGDTHTGTTGGIVTSRARSQLR